MALWTKIQSLTGEDQQKILALYNEEHPEGEFSFPIELRCIFAERIEYAVGEENGNGLDPTCPDHRDPIINFITTLITSLEERLGNPHSGDQFFTRHKLSQTLAKLIEQKQRNPLGYFEYIRNRIKAEQSLLIPQEPVGTNPNPVMDQQDWNQISDGIQNVKAQSIVISNTLQSMRQNEEQFTISFNQKQDYESILHDPIRFHLYSQRMHDCEGQLKANIGIQDAKLQENIQAFQSSIRHFRQLVTEDMSLITTLQTQITGKIATWKHEQQRMSNGIEMSHSLGLDQLQNWCRELADSILWKLVEHLKEAERMLRNGIISTGNPADLPFLENCIQRVITLIGTLLTHSLLVEEQPQILKTSLLAPQFPKPVVVCLLTGKGFNVHMNRPMLSVTIINEEQARKHPVVDTSGVILNGENHPMEYDENSGRLTVAFKKLKLKSIVRGSEYVEGKADAQTSNKLLVMEEKFCLYFKCEVAVGLWRFNVSTMSLPVTVTKHGSQEPLAAGRILWDNAFGEVGRTAFTVPDSAPWTNVAEVLNAKFRKVTGRDLTEQNLEYLAQKAFRNEEPQPATITYDQFCKTDLPNLTFSFWDWVFAALKLVEKANLQEMYKKGLIMGFVSRETAQRLISTCGPETFLFRFSDNLLGGISITYTTTSGAPDSRYPYQLLDLQCKKLAMRLKDSRYLKYIYQTPACLPKDKAFGEFYDKEGSQAKVPPALVTNPYTNVGEVLPDGNFDVAAAANNNGSPGPTNALALTHNLAEQPESPPELIPPSPFSSYLAFQGSPAPSADSTSMTFTMTSGSGIAQMIPSASTSTAPVNNQTAAVPLATVPVVGSSIPALSPVVPDQPSPLFQQLSFLPQSVITGENFDNGGLMNYAMETDSNQIMLSGSSQTTDFPNPLSFSTPSVNNVWEQGFDSTNWYGDKLPPFDDLIRIRTNIGQ